MKGEHAVRLLCKLLSVAPSGYYRWRKGGSSQRQCEDAAITEQIVVAHEASRGTYGVPRILEDLRDEPTKLGVSELFADLVSRVQDSVVLVLV